MTKSPPKYDNIDLDGMPDGPEKQWLLSERENAKRLAAPKTKPKEPKEVKKAKTGGRWWGTLSAFVDESMSTLSPAAASVWLVFFRFSIESKARVSISQLSKLTGLSERHAKRAAAELVERGLIIRLVRGNKQFGPTIYRFKKASSNGTPASSDPNS